jgi:peptide/nickel transport system substrate-binding protein
MKARLLFALLLTLAIVLSACAAPAAPAATGGEEAAAPAEAAAGGEGAVTEFRGIWPYVVPPAGHFNTFVSTNRINLGIYHHLMQPPLFLYMWADDDWLPMAGESWEWVDDVTIHVKLPEGAVWSDGSDYTAQDVVDTFDIVRLQGLTVWDFLDSVSAVDDYTVEFKLKEPSNTVLRRIFREINIRNSSTYGEFANRVRDLIASGADSESPEWQALLQEFNEFRPEAVVALGPYVMDMDSITESQIVLPKNETSFMADQAKFDRLIVFNGETPDATPLMLSKEADYATHGFPPATDQQFQAEGIRVIRGPNYNGPALYFNQAKYPFNVKEFRQALAYAIDRGENGIVSMAESAKPPQYMAGFSDNLAPLWLTDETKAALNPYEFDRDKAEQMLLDLGFTRDDDGVWIDDQGNRQEYELTAPSEFADWSAAAENLAEQLTDFGIATAFRGITFSQHPAEVMAGNFDMAIREWGAGNPHPQFSYSIDFNAYNSTGGEVEATTEAGPGMSFPLVQETDCCGEIDLADLTLRAGQGADKDVQLPIVNELALAYNELLPQIPLWERYGNNPAVEGVRIKAWPADDDPIYLNGTYADPFSIVLIVTGQLEPVDQ